MDAILEMMKRHGIPETRENYLALAYLRNPPDELTAGKAVTAALASMF